MLSPEEMVMAYSVAKPGLEWESLCKAQEAATLRELEEKGLLRHDMLPTARLDEHRESDCRVCAALKEARE